MSAPCVLHLHNWPLADFRLPSQFTLYSHGQGALLHRSYELPC